MEKAQYAQLVKIDTGIEHMFFMTRDILVNSLIRGLFGQALKTIRIRDTAVRKTKKENFCHGILLGLLSHREDWIVQSSAESGTGYSDTQIELPDDDMDIVIELKYAESPNPEASCQKALVQIEEKGYADRLTDDGMTSVIKYGIACRRNTCMVKISE